MSVPSIPAAPPAQFSPDTSLVKDPNTVAAIESLARAVALEFGKVTYAQRPQARALLMSPSKYVFSVTVDDNGNVTATRMRG